MYSSGGVVTAILNHRLNAAIPSGWLPETWSVLERHLPESALRQTRKRSFGDVCSQAEPGNEGSYFPPGAGVGSDCK